MTIDDNPAEILKEMFELMFPKELLIDDWEELWEEVIDVLNRYMPSNDN